MAEVRFEIIKHIGVISRRDRGGEPWTKEINKVSWNNAPAKVDIREWNEDHTIMSRGITLTEEETATLTEILAGRSK